LFAPATSVVVPCPICTGEDTNVDRELYDDRFGYPGHFSLFGCRTCGHRWLDVELDAEALYANYYPPRLHDPRARVPASSAAAYVPRDVSVLDIGCGSGNALAHHRARGCTVRGVEADANAVTVARAAGLSVDHGVFEPSLHAPESYDVVTLDQVIEHLADPIATLRAVRGILRHPGSVVIATPNAAGAVARLAGDRWIHWHAPYHVQFFTRDSLSRAATAAALVVESIDTVTDPEWLSYQWIHALTRPRVGTRSTLWSPSARHPGIRALRAVRYLGGERFVTRVCDRLGVGDNLIARLRTS
jgi:2-polyprenyl-3-methyl-5-hydroxy-6-metoxy-1,4-benzoquinol methylase